MFKIIKTLWGSLTEGINEGIEETKREKLASDGLRERLIQPTFTLEKHVIAFACPFREIMITSRDSGFSPHLYGFGYLNDKEKLSLKGLLIRDFNITDGKTALVAIENLIRPWTDQGKEETQEQAKTLEPFRSAEYMTFSCSTACYILSSAIDLNYLNQKEEDGIMKFLVGTILELDLGSWKNFGSMFIAGEKIVGINNPAGRRFFKMGLKRLLTNETSPWVTIPWNNLGLNEKSNPESK